MGKLRKNIRENKVIILIITIAILLILAGISIVELTGIFEKGLNKQMLADYESQLNNLGKSTVGSGDVTGGSGEHSGEDNEQGDQPPASQGQSASDIANVEDKSEVYGKQVTNYIVEGATDVKWDIFYADTENIYLIADDYIERSQFPKTKNGKKPSDGNDSYGVRTGYFNKVVQDYNGSADITDDKIKALNDDYFNKKGYTNPYMNMRAVAYMLDTEIWSKFAKKDVADYTIGGPTIEMLIKSYNQTYKTNYEFEATDEYRL